MKKKFEGKVVAITGASSGIGAATALAFAKNGAKLALIARNKQRLNDVAAQCRSLGAKAEIYIADTSIRSEIEDVIARIIHEFGGIDVMHCNAGIYLRCEAADLKIEQIQRIMEVNFFGTLHTVYAVLPHMTQRKSGSIITTCSMDGKKGVPPDAAYVASKFAINGFHQVMRQELRGTGVHVGLIFPSRTDTPQIAHVSCPGITPKAAPDLVANAVVKCAYRRKKEMMVPYGPCKLLVMAEAVSPSLGDWMVRTFKLDGMQISESKVKEVGL